MTYYGQRNTDEQIARYFEPGYVGICVEVGAYDGIKGSNTLHFEESGWDCLCIEPNPYVFPTLCRNRKWCVPAAVDNYIGSGDLEIFNFESGIQSSLTSLDCDPRLIEDYAEAITKRQHWPVAVRTLNDIFNLEGIKHVDFISIDTEGTELKVLEGLNLNVFKPKLLVVENNYNDWEMTDYLNKRGYQFIERWFVNNFYVKRDT